MGAPRDPHRPQRTRATFERSWSATSRASPRRSTQIAGRPFNVSSPAATRQSALRGDESFPRHSATGKGKTISTAADVLEELAEPIYEIVRKVLEYRQLTKLKGTYVDALPALIDPVPRAACTPALTRRGRPPDGSQVFESQLTEHPYPHRARPRNPRRVRAARGLEACMTADYSQIELRLLAHFSRDPVLLEAFRSGEDIHTPHRLGGLRRATAAGLASRCVPAPRP